MFGEKQLHEVRYEDLKEFLLEEREEGLRLDYKSAWSESVIETACAFANTYGGYVLYGVKEVKGENRTRPDPDDIPGIDFSRGSPLDSTRSRILSNTRPSIPLTLQPVFLGGSTNRAVIIIQVEESIDSPHEVLLASTTKRIPKRRADQTVPASLDEIEQLIQRRDNLRRQSMEPIGVEFFRGRFTKHGERDQYGYQAQEVPPILGITIRPRRVNTLGFNFNARVDKDIQQLALRAEAGESLRPRPTPFGLVIEDLHRDLQDTPSVRLEVHRVGTIRGAQALHRETEEWTKSDGMSAWRYWVDFGEIASSVCSIVRFAAAAYSQQRPGVEMEVSFGLSDAQGHVTEIPVRSPYRSYSGWIPGSDFYQQPIEQYALQVRTNVENGQPVEEDLLGLIREVSRIFQISVPDERLRFYL